MNSVSSRLCVNVGRLTDTQKFIGPGNCLGMLAAKSGPTAVRGQFYGIAAAIGKIGAFGGTWGKHHSIHAVTGPKLSITAS